MRRRLALLLAAAVAATSAALVPSPAQAVDVPAGALEPGVQTTAAFPDDETRLVYTLEVPAGARPTLTVVDVVGPVEFFSRLVYADGSSGGFASYFGADPRPAVMEHEAPADTSVAQTATLTVSNATRASVTFVLGFVTDAVLDVEPGAQTLLTFTTPGQRARLDFDAPAGATVTVDTSNDALTSDAPVDDLGRLALRLLPQGTALEEQSRGIFAPVEVGTGGTQTLVVNPVAGLTGTVTVRVNVTPPGATTLFYDAFPVTTALEGASPVVLAVFGQDAARTALQIVEPSLTAPAGPAAVRVELLRHGADPVVLGTLDGDEAVTLTTPERLGKGELALIHLVPLGGTTGVVGLRLFLDPGPATALAIGGSAGISVPAGATSGRFTVAAGTDETLELFLTDITLGSPDAFTSPFRLEAPSGAVVNEGTLFRGGATAIPFTAARAGTYTLVIPVSPPEGLTATAAVVRPTATTQSGTLPFDGPLTLAAPGENARLVVPATAGTTLVASVTDVDLTNVPGSQFAASVVVLGPDGAPVAAGDLPRGGSTSVEAPVAQDGEYTVVVDGAFAATGSVRVVVDTARLDTQVLARSGAPSTVSMSRRGDSGRFTFEGQVGEGIAVEVQDVTLVSQSGFAFANATLFRPDGSFYTSYFLQTGSTLWIEPTDGLDAAGTWSLLVDPGDDTTGTVTARLVVPRILSAPLQPGSPLTVPFERAGDVQRLTFTGTAGQRPVLDISDRTVATRMRLVAPSGLVTADVSGFDTSEYFEFPVFQQSGRWTLELDAFDVGTGSVGVLLGLVNDPVRTVTAGSRVTSTFTKGQNPRLRLDLRAGSRAVLDVASVVPDGTSVTARFLRPDGSQAAAVPFSTAGSWVEMPEVADVSGRWTVQLDPEGPVAGRVVTTVRTAAERVVTGRLGRFTTVDVKNPGENVVLPFRGSDLPEPQFVGIDVVDSTFEELQIRLVSPDGFTTDAAVVGPGTSGFGLRAGSDLTGRWSVVVDPVGRSTGKARIRFRIGDFF